MKLTRTLFTAAILAGASITAQAASAQAVQTAVFSLKDIGTFATYQTNNTGQTFSGTGFVGAYSDNTFAHLFGLEGSYSRTNAQVDLASLLGSTIQSATLSYSILSNNFQNGVVTITGSGGTGALGYAFAAPTVNYGTATGTTLGTNTANVTNLVAAATASGNNWLNLFFQDSVSGNWTYTAAGQGGNPDSAAVRLTVNYVAAAVPGAVPEPASWAMMILGMGAIGYAMRRRVRTSEVRFDARVKRIAAGEITA